MTHDLALLEAARFGYQRHIEELDEQIAALTSKQPQQRKISAVETPAAPIKRKSKMSVAGRKRIGDASKKRWAEFRAKKAKTGSAAA
jgi:hypothetical protein